MTQREFFDCPVDYPFLKRNKQYNMPTSLEPAMRRRPLDASLTSAYKHQVDPTLQRTIDVHGMIPMLRTGESSSPYERRKENKWN